MTQFEIRPLEFRDGMLHLLDQRALPRQTIWIECRDHSCVAEAICTLAVRGAPAIGLAAAYGTVLAAQRLVDDHVTGPDFSRELTRAMDELAATRPTAVNLFWALARMRHIVEANEGEPLAVLDALRAAADRMMREDAAANRAMGAHGAELVPAGANILTHCNTGALVTSALGTALGTIRAAHEQGKKIHVWVDETRPLLQGARLTAWELQQLGIPFTLITDSMAGHFMSRGQVDLVMTGADRIAANGDTANKIGTYSVAVLARAHEIPFYVVAPTSTVDLSLDSGASIRIEERKPEEVTTFGGVQVAPHDVRAANPAFDVTPAHLIAGIVTEHGVARPPFREDLARHVQAQLQAVG